MTPKFPALGAALFLAACGTSPVPDSNPHASRGVGFGSEQQYEAMREANFDARVMAAQQAPATEEQAIAAETMTALNIQTPASAPAAAAAPITAIETVSVVDNPDISDEQNFDAVASRETIDSDADRLARNREQFVQVQPAALPERDGAGGPNIVAYALATNHPVGTAVHSRSGRSTPERFSRVCQSYGTDDQAQQAFLANGGPERDRKGVDPDGDGYACDWNPQPFRMARGG